MAVINHIKNTELDEIKRTRLEIIFLTLSFFLFMFPFSLAIGDEGLSANYSFLLLPLFYLYKDKIKLPNTKFLLIISFYTIIFIIASLYQFEFYQFFYRRLISFIIFITMFSYLFIKIDNTLISCFKNAIVLIAIFFSFTTLFKFIFLGGNDLGFAGKGEVGSQRFGFIYIMSLWILIFYDPRIKIKILFKYIMITLIIIGLLLTFSRSGIVAMGATLILFYFNSILRWFKSPTYRGITTFIILLLFMITGFFLLYIYFPLLFEFFNTRLFTFFLGTGEETLDVSNEDSSEGFRIFLIKKVLSFVFNNPFTGGGYLGVWVLFEELSGSAHNQYLDILFRTGIIGLIIYIYLLYSIIITLKKLDKTLYWGVLGVVIYGLFHETFKLSQGAFVFSFLLGVVGNRNKLLKNNE
jgi:O-antigen ligase